jgi:hypothetical protein
MATFFPHGFVAYRDVSGPLNTVNVTKYLVSLHYLFRATIAFRFRHPHASNIGLRMNGTVDHRPMRFG